MCSFIETVCERITTRTIEDMINQKINRYLLVFNLLPDNTGYSDAIQCDDTIFTLVNFFIYKIKPLCNSYKHRGIVVNHIHLGTIFIYDLQRQIRKIQLVSN